LFCYSLEKGIQKQFYIDIPLSLSHCVRRRSYLWPPRSDMATDVVIGIAMKRCIHRPPIHPNQRPLRRPKLCLTKSAISTAAEVGQGRPWSHWNLHENMRQTYAHRHPIHPDQRSLKPPKPMLTHPPPQWGLSLISPSIGCFHKPAAVRDCGNLYIKRHFLMAAATHGLSLWNGKKKINYKLIKPKLVKIVISKQA
jgi:hypothetical protein